MIMDIPQVDRATKADLDKRVSSDKDFGSRVNCSRRQVLIFLCFALRRIGVNKEERVEENGLNS